MPLPFAVNRMLMNHGVGTGLGVWEYEQFMFGDSTFGRATVEYRHKRLSSEELGPEDILVDQKVAALTVFTDDGDEIPLTQEAWVELSDIVLEAFEDDEDHVLEYLRENT